MGIADLPLFGIESMVKSMGLQEHYEYDLLFLEVDDSLNRKGQEAFLDVRLNVLALFLVVEGEAELTIDYKAYHISQNNLLTLIPSHALRTLSQAANFRGYMIAVSKSFMDDYGWFPKKGGSMLSYMEIRKHPCELLTPQEAETVLSGMARIRQALAQTSHTFYKEMIQNTLMGLFLDLGHIFTLKKELTLSPALTRKENLLEQFFRLLFEHCKEQHGVDFYAGKMCISSQYLSVILKNLTGKPASKWIDDYLIKEAKVFLKAPDVTVQQVANQLCFSDQSTFGKFFKKHVGMSPLEYRRSR